MPVEAEVELAAGAAYEVVAELDAAPAEGPIALAGLTVEARPPAQPDAVERAVQAAAGADVAVVVVGQDERETEGKDATTMDLPPEQVALIRQVAAANPRTVVVVNAASPVTMDWADDVAAVVQMSYLGQETGAALAAVLFGDADASGRLTTTYPRRLEDSPAFAELPRPGRHRRATPRASSSATATTTRTGSTRAGASGTACRTRRSPTRPSPWRPVGPTTATTHRRAGVGRRHQHRRPRRAARSSRCTCAPSTPRSPRPDRELKAFEKVTLDPGETTTVTVALDRRAFAYWDTQRHGWHAPAGDVRDPGRIVLTSHPPDRRLDLRGQVTDRACGRRAQRKRST